MGSQDGNAPESDYAKMLDDAVKEIKQNEERRYEYMSIYADIADEREIGEYSTYVKLIRTNKRNLLMMCLPIPLILHLIQ